MNVYHRHDSRIHVARQREHAHRVQRVLFEGQRASPVRLGPDSVHDPRRDVSETVQRRRDVHRAQVPRRVPAQVRVGVSQQQQPRQQRRQFARGYDDVPDRRGRRHRSDGDSVQGRFRAARAGVPAPRAVPVADRTARRVLFARRRARGTVRRPRGAVGRHDAGSTAEDAATTADALPDCATQVQQETATMEPRDHEIQRQTANRVRRSDVSTRIRSLSQRAKPGFEV